MTEKIWLASFFRPAISTVFTLLQASVCWACW